MEKKNRTNLFDCAQESLIAKKGHRPVQDTCEGATHPDCLIFSKDGGETGHKCEAEGARRVAVLTVQSTTDRVEFRDFELGI